MPTSAASRRQASCSPLRAASRWLPRFPAPRLCAPLATVSVLALALSACSVAEVHRYGPTPRTSEPWCLLPFLNRSEAPRVGERLEPVVATLLAARGVRDLVTVPPQAAGGPERAESFVSLDDRARRDRAIAWAVERGIRYGVTGSVTEWRYKAGLDGEPAVGLQIEIIDLSTGRSVWSAVGARAGWGRESLSGTAQILLSRLLDELELGLVAGTFESAQDPVETVAPASHP